MNDLSNNYGDCSEIEKQLSRVYEITGTRTQLELADVLGIKQSAISDAKKRGKIPDSWLITLLRLYNVNPGWILLDSTHQFLTPTYAIPEPAKGKSLGPSYEMKILQQILSCVPVNMLIIELRRRRGKSSHTFYSEGF